MGERKPTLNEFKKQIETIFGKSLTSQASVAAEELWKNYAKILEGVSQKAISVNVDPLFLSRNLPEYKRYHVWKGLGILVAVIGIILFFIWWKIGIAVFLSGLGFHFYGKYIRTSDCRRFMEQLVQEVKRDSSKGMANLCAHYIAGTIQLASENGRAHFPQHPLDVLTGGRNFIKSEINKKEALKKTAGDFEQVVTEDKAPKEKKKSHARETFEAIVIALVLALLIRTFVIQAFKIPSSSMEDTLLVGDHIIVSKFAYGFQAPKPAMIKIFGVTVPFFETRLIRTWGGVKRGDIIVFRYPGDRSKDYIKRVIGLPGDTVEVKDRIIYINGSRWDDRHAVHKGWMDGIGEERGDNFGPYKVPAGHVFCMGDNRERSFDSRFWGPVPIKDIKGKAFLIYWSWDKNSHWIRVQRMLNLLH